MENDQELHKGFEGWAGGAVYDLIALLTGYGGAYYRRAAGALPIRPGMTLVDLGCGTGSLTSAMAGKTGETGRAIGIDIAEKQLARARSKYSGTGASLEFRKEDLAALPFEDGSIDGLSMSQVIHMLPDEARVRMIGESFRVLKPGGFFGLIEWSRPRFGYGGLVWGLSLLKSKETDNWKGTHPAAFADAGFELVSDRYLDSLNRCQILRKPEET